MPDPLVFDVDGVPVPEGSMIARIINGRPIVVPANGNELKVWRRNVTATASGLLQHRSAWPHETPVEVTLKFRVHRGSTVVRPLPSVRKGGDVDKLARAVLDALQNAGVFVDDAQVTDLHVKERYGTPGVLVRVADAPLDDLAA